MSRDDEPGAAQSTAEGDDEPAPPSLRNDMRKSCSFTDFKYEPEPHEKSILHHLRPQLHRLKSAEHLLDSAGSLLNKVSATEVFLQEDVHKKHEKRIEKGDAGILGDFEGTGRTEGLTGVERVNRLIRNPAMEGLMKSTRDGEIKKYGVSIDILQRVIVEDEMALNSCLSLPITVFFFCMFMTFFQQHYQTSFLYLQERNLRKSLGADAVQVSSPNGIYDWMEDTLVPFLWSTNRDLGEGTQASAETSEYQELMGGFLLRTQRSKTLPCSDEIVAGRYYICSDMSTVNATGKSVQEDKFLGELGGWRRSTAKNNQRRLHAESSGEDVNWFESAVNYLAHWFPRQAFHPRLATWKKVFNSSESLETATVLTFKPADGFVRAGKRSRDKLTRRRRTRRRRYRGWLFQESDMSLSRQRNASSVHGRRLAPHRPEFSMGGWYPFPYVRNDVWEYIVPMSSPETSVQNLIAHWRQGEIIDRSTLFFGIEGIFRNDQIGNGVVSHMFVNFIFSRGGGIYAEVVIQSLVLKDDKKVVFSAFVWICTLIGNTIATPGRTCSAWRKGKLMTHLKRSWNLLEWFLIMFGWIIIMAFVMERWSMRKFHEHYSTYSKARKTSPASELESLDIGWMNTIHTNLYNAGLIDSFLVSLVANYHIFLILRFFVASRGQRRLAIVVKTFQHAAIDLVHLFAVVCLFFFAYVMAGHILFGSRMPRFATVEGALAYVIQIVLQKEFDFHKLSEENFWTAAVWVYSFVVLVVLVMVNIVLAMIYDHYGEVRREVSDDDSMWFTAARIWSQIHNFNNWAPNFDLLLATKSTGTDRISVKGFKQKMPGICQAQVAYLFLKAKQKVELDMTRGGRNAVTEAMACVLIGVANLVAAVKLTSHGGYHQAVGGDPANFGDLSCGGEITTLDATDELIVGPDGQPHWLKIGLLPFLEKQAVFLKRVQRQIAIIESKMWSIGVGKDIPPCPCAKPANPMDEDSDIVEPLIYAPRSAERPEAGQQVKRQAPLAGPPPTCKMPEGIGKSALSQPGSLENDLRAACLRELRFL